MKKISFILFLIFLTSLQLLANGKIVEIDGNVSIQRANTNEWLPAKINMEVNNTDRIRTLFASSAIIKLSDGSNITVAENTVLDLSSIADKKNINVKVVFGGLKANVMKKDLKERAEFRVSTPTAVAGVRGTEFDVLENARGGAKFLVVDGAIEVQSKKGKIELSKGEKIEISADGDLGKIEKAEEKESLVVLTDMIKEKVIELKETLIQEEKKLIEEGKKEEPEKDVKDDTAVEEKKAPIEKQEPSDTQISQPRGELPASAADTAVAATGKEKADTDAAKPKAQDQQKKEDIKAVLTPIITEPIDKTTIYTNRINIRVSAEPNYMIVLKVNNSEVGRQNSRAKEVVFSNIQLRDGQNRISVVGIDPKGATSSEAAININVITAVSAPQIISPAAGQNFDRGPAPTITLASSEFSEWTKRNPMNITGRISYKRQITLPEIKGRWLTAQGQGIEGEISATVSVDGEEAEYQSRSDASGNFSISGIMINLSDDKFITKVNNDDVQAIGGNFQYLWIMEQGRNRLTIDAQEKTINILIKLRGKTMSGLESPIATFNYTSTGKSNSLVREQNLDSLAPVIQVNPIVSDNKVRITVREPEPTSGVYKVTVDGFNCKRIEGAEKDSEQVWEANIQLTKPNLPPPPPNSPGYRRTLSLKIRATDRAENTTEKNETITIFYE